MRVAAYNQMFGLNALSFLSTIIGHWAVHYQKYARKIWQRTDVLNTARTIAESGADIVGVMEVLEGQERELIEELKKLGYRYFYFSKGSKTKHTGLYIQGMLCSKIKGVQIKTKNWPVGGGFGGGGGFVHVYFEDLRSHFMLVHLDLPSEKYQWEQIVFLRDYLRNLKERTVLFGDFNLSYNYLSLYFPDFDLASGRVKTCSTNPVLRLFYNKDIDHIMVKGLKGVRHGTVKGKSDHKLVYADLK